MPRPCCIRNIDRPPDIVLFKPAGVPSTELVHVVIELDELEALRLSDCLGLYHEEAAARMNISRPTFSRIIERARRKVADALLHGKALRFEGGAVNIHHGEDEMNAHRKGHRHGGCGCGAGMGKRTDTNTQGAQGGGKRNGCGHGANRNDDRAKRSAEGEQS